ncbi:GtrA family protein [Homoserinimonas sp. A520]
MRTLLTQLTRFGLVGLIGLVIDVSVFNLLRLTVFSPEALHEGPVVAKVISTSLAIVANWMGNRHWTFARERRGHLAREGAEFFLVSFGGMLIGLFCLWMSHYVLGYQSLLADNVSSNVVGLALGTAFRFWGYRVWVFREPADAPRQARLVSTLRQAQARPRFARPTGLRGSARGSASTSSAGFDKLNPLNAGLRPSEGSVAPAGGAPAHRIQAVAPVDDDARPHH